MKLPGISAAPSGPIGERGGAAGAMKTMGSALHQPQGGAAATRQENSDLSKVVEDLLHDQLMGKMGGGAGGEGGPLGGLRLHKGEGGHGPAIAKPSFGGLQQSGGQSPLQGMQQENGDLKKLLLDLLKGGGGSGGQAPAAGPQLGQGEATPRFRIGTVAQPQQGQGAQQGGIQGENDDLKKLLEDLLKGAGGGDQAHGAPQFRMGTVAQPQEGQGAQQAGAQRENSDLKKLIEDLLKGPSSAQGADSSSDSSDPLQQIMQSLQQQNEKMKTLMGMIQQSTQQSTQQSPLAMLQNMMQSTQQSPLADLQKMMTQSS